jgi:hypothetical protein
MCSTVSFIVVTLLDDLWIEVFEVEEMSCIHYRNYWISFSSYFHVYGCSFALFQVETVNTILMNVQNHQNRATMAYVSIVWVCVIESNIKMDLKEIG